MLSQESVQNTSVVFQCVAFDFDGTLANTTPAIVATVQDTLDHVGMSWLRGEHILPFIGLSLEEAFGQLGVSQERIAECATCYRERFSRHSGQVQLFFGVETCLQGLQMLGLRLAIVSSRGRASLLRLLEQLQIAEYFTCVLGAEDAGRGKPAPDLVLRVAEEHRLEPAQILVVGDTTFDIEMGHAAGAQTCAVTYGNHNAARLAKANPHHQVDSLGELGELLRRNDA